MGGECDKCLVAACGKQSASVNCAKGQAPKWLAWKSDTDKTPYPFDSILLTCYCDIHPGID